MIQPTSNYEERGEVIRTQSSVAPVTAAEKVSMKPSLVSWVSIKFISSLVPCEIWLPYMKGPNTMKIRSPK